MATTPEATKGVPRIEGNPAPSLRADHNALADWAKNNVHASFTSTANRDADPLKWEGKVVETSDTDTLWLCIDPAGSGTWRVVSEDTGWATLAANGAGGWTATATTQYRRVNGVVFVRGDSTKGSAFVAPDPMTAALPAGFRPARFEMIAAVHGNGVPGVASVQTTGIITAYAASGGSAELIFHGSFIAEA